MSPGRICPAKIASQHAVVEEHLHDLRYPADLVQIRGDVAAGGLEVAEHRYPGTDGLEVIDREGHLGCVGYGQQVQHGVGRAAEGHHHGDCIVERLARHNLPRQTLCTNGVDQHRTRTRGVLRLF
jgi:hypothetical protein